MRKTTKRTLKRIGLGALLVFVVLGAYGVFIEPRFLLEVREETAMVPGLPAAWEGQRLGVIADLQVGMWLGNERAMREAVDGLLRRRPAAVLVLGDFVYDPDADEPAEFERELREAVAILRPLTEAGVPLFAVLGNHDYGMNTAHDDIERGVAEKVVEGLRSMGVTVLRNEAVRLGEGDQALYLVGVDSEWAGRSNPLEALAGVPSEAPRLVLMHNPDSFAGFPPSTAPVAVAGHTHGGQIRIPFLPHWSMRSLFVQGESHTDGWIVDPDFGAPGNQLYVSRGIGMSTVPVRINCPPEVTLFTLRRGDATARAGGGA